MGKKRLEHIHGGGEAIPYKTPLRINSGLGEMLAEARDVCHSHAWGRVPHTHEATDEYGAHNARIIIR